MVRGWLGAGILAALLALGILTSAAMADVHRPTGQLLEQAAETTLEGDFSAGVELGMAAKKRWEKSWKVTASVADHSPMDDVDALFGEMEVYARAGEAPHFAACCKELSQRLRAVADAHQWSWWNVL